MKNISVTFLVLLLRLGILAVPHILLLLITSTVRADVINDATKNTMEIKQQEPLASQVEVPSVKLEKKVSPQNVVRSLNKGENIPSVPQVSDDSTITNNQSTSHTEAPHIVILSPTVGTVLDAPAATVVIQMPSDTKIELLVNGKAVNSNLIGRSELDETNKTVTQTWYGVPLQAGDNTIAVRAIGTESVASSVNLKVRSAPVRLLVSTLESDIPSDGRSYATIEGQLVDESGNRSNWDGLVTLEASDGEFIGSDASTEQPGFQVQVKQGKFTAQLRSGLKAGMVTIRAVDGKMEAFTQIQFTTDLRPSLVTGIIDLRLGARGTDFYGKLEEFLPADLNNGTQLSLYGAIFGTGRVGDWLFTGAYNSNRTLNQDCAGNNSLFGAQKICNSQYSVYGDSSTSSLTAPSYDSLFLRFERNSPVKNAGIDYFMWGDFNTDEFTSKSQQFSGISRQLHGFKGNFNLGDLQITGFYSNVGNEFQRDTIAPNGTSGTYFLSHQYLISGSETVTTELVDFFTATVISSKQLVRGQDYNINYDNGTLLFMQPLLQTEIGSAGQLLRRQIVVTYEDQQGGNSNIYGGQLRYFFNRSLSQPSWIGANYFQQNQGIRNFILYGLNALITFGEKTQLIAEYANSQNDSDVVGHVSGSAMRLELYSEISSGLIGKLYYSHADTGFANDATISFVPGQTKYGAELNAKISPNTSLKFRYDENDTLGVAPQPLTSIADLIKVGQQALPGSPVDNSLNTISVGLQQNIGNALLNLDLLLRNYVDRINPISSSNSTQLQSSLSIPIANNLKLTTQNLLTLSSTPNTVIPDGTQIALDWLIVPGLTARLGQQWFSSGSLAGNSITSANLIGEYKLGNDTSFTGRYSVLGGADAISTQGSLGLHQRWQVLPGLRINFGYEHVFGSFATTTNTGTSYLQPYAVGQASSTLTLLNGDSYNIGFEYTDNPDFKASAKFEQQNNNSAGSSTVLSASALGKLTPALTLLFKYQQSSAANQLLSGLGTIADLKVGLAFRDPQDDKLNLLLSYEYRQNPSIVPDALLLGSGTGYNDSTLALEAIYAPNWQWEFYGKLALRNSTTTIAQDFTGVSNTNLEQFRVTYRAGYNVELVGETRFLNQPTADYSEMGLVGELGYYLTPNLRLAAGYSSGSVNADPGFSGSRSAGGLYAGITVKLNELFDGFGLQKTPPRQQQDPVDPQVSVAQPAQPSPKLAAVIPDTPQLISLNIARSLTFKENKQGNSAELAIADVAVLENLAAVLKEYSNLSLDIQGYIGSLSDMNSGDNLAANRMMAARKYLLDRGVASTQMTLRSLGSLTASTSDSAIYPIKFALNGKSDVFNAIATRLQTMSSNSPATEFLQSVLPNAAPTFQANAVPVNANLSVGKSNPNIGLGVNVGNDGKIADLSYANLDRMIERLNANPALTIEIQSRSALSASASQDMDMFKLSAVRNYLLDKGINSDRILLSDAKPNANIGETNQTENSQVYVSLIVDDSNSNVATTPTTVPTSQASATTIPVPLASAADSASRRLATAFNFLLSDRGDTVTALIQAMGISTSQRSGFAIDLDRLLNIKN